MTSRPRVPPRTERSEPRDVAELRELRRRHPELAPAIDLELDLIGLLRRLQARVPLPVDAFAPERVLARLESGRRLLDFDDIQLEWSEFRVSLREAADLLRHHEILDPADHQHMAALSRQGQAIEPMVREWYDASAAPLASGPRPPLSSALEPFATLLTVAMRPFLVGAALAMLPRLDLSAWQDRSCPLCGAEPDFCVIGPDGRRDLVCARCHGRWTWDPAACPHCGTDDRARLRRFAASGGRHVVFACDACHRYIKGYDERGAPRGLLVSVDAVATLPLDAAAIQQGYA
ncbi:MAG: formate dehydrogenase accessory protein FdhE [Vicinamibacteraceae bacterium]|nr:formate dehydrogenase accessory protein FdhE [Vicinamibacteraceae bacterium]